MRKIIDLQMKIGEVSVADIKFDLRSRDEIPKLLCGLQGIYCNREIREQVLLAGRSCLRLAGRACGTFLDMLIRLAGRLAGRSLIWLAGRSLIC